MQTPPEENTSETSAAAIAATPPPAATSAADAVTRQGDEAMKKMKAHLDSLFARAIALPPALGVEKKSPPDGANDAEIEYAVTIDQNDLIEKRLICETARLSEGSIYMIAAIQSIARATGSEKIEKVARDLIVNAWNAFESAHRSDANWVQKYNAVRELASRLAQLQDDVIVTFALHEKDCNKKILERIEYETGMLKEREENAKKYEENAARHEENAKKYEEIARQLNEQAAEMGRRALIIQEQTSMGIQKNAKKRGQAKPKDTISYAKAVRIFNSINKRDRICEKTLCRWLADGRPRKAPDLAITYADLTDANTWRDWCKRYLSQFPGDFYI